MIELTNRFEIQILSGPLDKPQRRGEGLKEWKTACYVESPSDAEYLAGLNKKTIRVVDTKTETFVKPKYPAHNGVVIPLPKARFG